MEEYKRPTFEVSFKDDGAAALRLNSPATLKGEARYYFGLPVTSGQVKWRVSRTPQYPWWWWEWGWSAPASRTQVVASGTSQLTADGTFEVTSFWGLLLNPWALMQYAHNMSGAVITGTFVVAAVGSYYLLEDKFRDDARAFLRVAVIVGVIACAAQIFPTGDMQGKFMAVHQPATTAAMESLFHSEIGAPLGILGQSGTLGGSFTLAVGSALSSRVRGSDQVTMCFFGDGSANRGTFHEGANAAGVWKLPIVWICENNGLAVSTRFADSCAGGSIAARAAGYGMPGIVVDGQDVVAVRDATREAIARARRGDGPTLIEAMTCRFRGHYEGDNQEYRDREELERLKRERDPLVLLAARVTAQRPSAQADLDRIRQAVAAEVEAAASKALAGTAQTQARIPEHLYA